MGELENVLNLRGDFDEFLRENDFHNARICIDAMGEKGEEMEALKMFQEYNRKLTGGSYEDGLVSDRAALAEELV